MRHLKSVLGPNGQTLEDLCVERFLIGRSKTLMASVFLIGLDQTIATQVSRALAVERHRIETKPQNLDVNEMKDVDIVFAGGEPAQYLSLLRQVRETRPTLPFVVVTRVPETTAWLDALEAGATDYCSSPFESRQIHWLMESALQKHRVAAA
jgi:DNA-binding response OmpR family regulator